LFSSDAAYLRDAGVHHGLHAIHASAAGSAAASAASAADLPNKRPRIDLSHPAASVASPLTIDTREAVKVRQDIFLHTTD
jgi:hypothetical protein